MIPGVTDTSIGIDTALISLVWVPIYVGLLLGIITILVVAIRRRNVPAMVNAILSLGLALLPWGGAVFVQGSYGLVVPIWPELVLWISIIGLCHSFGMLGPYDDIWWWDHLTHVLAASLLASLIYGGIIVVIDAGIYPTVSRTVMALLTVTFTLVLGVLWEFIELVGRAIEIHSGINPVLVHYGWRDTACDLVFDMMGALTIVIFDIRVFVPLADASPPSSAWVLIFIAGAAFISIVLLGLLMLVHLVQSRDHSV